MHIPTTQNKLSKYLIDFCSKHGLSTADFAYHCYLPDGKNIPISTMFTILRTGEIKHTKYFFAICDCISRHSPFTIGFVMNRIRLILTNEVQRRSLDV